ncbi:extracellular solute-binding protein [Candidatus Chloroploca asiatica]|uniref:ABC transporter substrate-binding protein n=1 Tax=Candidatus Chloroploca asiatica TaxID=1506545 RepID=A0A2H3KQZ9_9CHLR|nr:extracellular solute-binding protein [Candidatus Chloroploca asiatica]PDW00838.1 ABC transporter substrate-binding protein [Candidatus Chloroploca asiatica]
MKRFVSFVALTTLLALLLVACGGQTATPPPAPTEPSAPTTPEDPSGVTGTVTLWHAYGTGSAEEEAVNTLVANARAAYPDATINMLQIPFDQIFNKFQNEVTSGAGPDMFIAPNDSLGDQIRAGLLADLTEYVPMLEAENVSPTAIEGMSLNGQLYAIPESFKAVALYYNTSKVATPPTTTDELLALVRNGNTLVLNQSAYHNFGWMQAFGAELMDADGRCVADTTGGDTWLAFLQELKAEPNVTFSTDGGQADSLFKEGRADMTINGPWALGDYRTALGDDLAVAAMPGSTNPAGPMTGVDGFYVNINSANISGAVALAMFLTSAESMDVYVNQAGHVPARTDIAIESPLVQGFADAAQTGVPRPQVPELSNFWTPFGDAITKVLDGGAAPDASITEACATMNAANNK